MGTLLWASYCNHCPAAGVLVILAGSFVCSEAPPTDQSVHRDSTDVIRPTLGDAGSAGLALREAAANGGGAEPTVNDVVRELRGRIVQVDGLQLRLASPASDQTLIGKDLDSGPG
jgi:hypothetical protein